MTILTRDSLATTEIKQFYIAMSDLCNLRCCMCSTSKHPQSRDEELPLEAWQQVIERITQYKVGSVGFGGGEPLLRRDVLEAVIPRVVSKGIKVNVITNSTLLDRSFLERLADGKEKILFVLSLDGLEERNDAIRGAGVFQKVMAAVRLFQEYGYTFLFTSVLMPQNFSGFIEFVEFIRTNFPDVYHDIQPVIPHNEVYYLRNQFHLTSEELSDLDRLLSYLREHYDHLKMCRPLALLERYRDYFTNTLSSRNQCKMGTEGFNINKRGNIWICGREIDYPLYKYSLEEVVSSPEYVDEMQRVQQCTSPCLAGLVI